MKILGLLLSGRSFAGFEPFGHSPQQGIAGEFQEKLHQETLPGSELCALGVLSGLNCIVV